MSGVAPQGFSGRLSQLRAQVPTLVLVGLSAGLAWYIAERTFGDQAAVFAPIAAALTLGFAAEHADIHRAIRVALGVALGLTVADSIVDVIGVGVWQMGIVVALARAGTFLADGTVLAVNQATVTAVLVVALHEDGVFPGDRFIDALIGASIALVGAAILRRLEAHGLRRPVPLPPTHKHR